MLGVVVNPTTTPSDLQMQRLAEQFGKGETFRPTPVGVFFGRDGAQGTGHDSRRSVLRRRRAGAHRLPGVRRVHDRLPARREERL